MAIFKIVGILKTRGKTLHGVELQLDTWKLLNSSGCPPWKALHQKKWDPCIGRYTHGGWTVQWEQREPLPMNPSKSSQGRVAWVFHYIQIHAFFYLEKQNKTLWLLSDSQRMPNNPNKVCTPACKWHIDTWVPQGIQETAAVSSLIQYNIHNFSLKIRTLW